MIKFLDVAAPEIEEVSNTNPIIVISILVILVVAIIVLGLKIREKK